MSHDYTTKITLEVTPKKEWGPKVIVSIRRDHIEFTGPELKESNLRYATLLTQTIFAAVRRAKKIHHQVFGRACR